MYELESSILYELTFRGKRKTRFIVMENPSPIFNLTGAHPTHKQKVCGPSITLGKLNFKMNIL